MTFLPDLAALLGHEFDDVDGHGLTHREWMDRVRQLLGGVGATVPTGGLLDQLLAKASDADYDWKFADGVPLALTGQSPPQDPLPAATTGSLGVSGYAMRGDAVISACPAYIPINNQTGTSYAPVLTDVNKLVTLSNASAITVTIPANGSVAFPVGSSIEWMWLGAGQPTFAITTDTLRSTPGLKLRAQYSRASLVKISSTVWSLAGDLSA